MTSTVARRSTSDRTVQRSESASPSTVAVTQRVREKASAPVAAAIDAAGQQGGRRDEEDRR